MHVVLLMICYAMVS